MASFGRLFSAFAVLMVFNFSPSSFAHHGGGASGGGSGDGAAEVIDLPIMIGLDGTVSWGFGGSASAHPHDHSGHTNPSDPESDPDHHDHHHDGEMDAHSDGQDDSMADSEHSHSLMPMLSLGYLQSDKKVRLPTGEITRYRSRAYDLGLGLMLMREFHQAGHVLAQVGFLMDRNSMKSTQQTAKSLAAADQLPVLQIPSSVEDLRSWTIGDQLTFGAQGGVSFSAGFGKWPVGTSAQYSARGGWIINLTKTAEESVRVLLRRDRSRGMAVNAGSVVVEIGKSLSSNFDEEFSFEFNLGHADGLEAYHAAMAGDWVAVEDLWKKQNDGVVRLSEGSNESRLKSGRFRFGIPFAFRFNSTHDSQQSFGEKDYFSEEENEVSMKERAVFATLTRTQSTVSLTHERVKKTAIFAGGVTSHLHGGALQHRHPTGAMKWFFEREKMPKNRMKAFLAKIAQETGFDRLKEISAPESDRKYARLSVDLTLREKGMRRILDSTLLKEKMNETLAGLVREAVEQDFKRYCEEGTTSEDCYHEFVTDMRKSSGRIALQVRKLKADFTDNRDADFASGFKKIGKVFLSNPILLQSFLKEVGEDGFGLKVMIEGEAFAPLSVDLNPTPTGA